MMPSRAEEFEAEKASAIASVTWPSEVGLLLADLRWSHWSARFDAVAGDLAILGRVVGSTLSEIVKDRAALTVENVSVEAIFDLVESVANQTGGTAAIFTRGLGPLPSPQPES